MEWIQQREENRDEFKIMENIQKIRNTVQFDVRLYRWHRNCLYKKCKKVIDHILVGNKW